MLIRSGLAAAVITAVMVVTPAGAADLGGYSESDELYENQYAYDTRYGPSSRRNRYRNRLGYPSRLRDWGPLRPYVFLQLRDDLEDAGYTRIAYHDERTDRYGDAVYYLTACQDGVRYRMHVTADCEIELKRRAGYCRSSIY